ncbi:MAG: AAA family ATPase [Caldilineaceae bacterium]
MTGPASHVAPSIQITTFGTLQVVRDGQKVDESAWRTRQARQLLKVLVTERPRPVATDRLIDLLWPGNSVDSAATTLRSAINALRNVLEPDRPNRAPSRYIHTQSPGYAYRTHPDVWLDVEVFENLLRQAERSTSPEEKKKLLADAIALYKDDYLISDPYADWVKGERERLRELYFHAILSLAEFYSKEGNYPDAISLARRVLAKDEVRENAYQALMRYLAESGDSAAALIAYERCRSILGEELGADPSPVTQELHSRILNGEIDVRSAAALAAHSPQSPPASGNQRQASTQPGETLLPQQTLLPTLDDPLSDTFVGRAAEMDAIGRGLAQALAGEGSIALLAGEAGVGKSRLAYEILRRAEAAGTTVISAACQQLERNLPYAPLADGISRYLQLLPESSLRRLPPAALVQLVQILPTLQDRLGGERPESSDSTLPDENRQRIVDGIVTFLTRLSELRPLVLFLDDLHWADADSLAVLSRLSQQISRFPILLLLAYREEDLAENESPRLLLRALRRAPFCRAFAVERLTPDETRALVGQLLGQNAGEVESLASALFRTTAGNALFLTEAVKNLRERSQLAGEENELLERPVPSQRVQEIIEERMERLPRPSLDVLRLAAVIGRDFGLDLLEGAAESDPATGLDVLLRRQFLLERPDERIDFVHQIVRQVAYDQLNSLQRRRLHAQVAAALVAGGKADENPAETAFHFGQAGSSARLEFAHYSLLAGESLLRTYAPQQAILHFDRGLAALSEINGPPAGQIERGFLGLGLAYEGLLDPDGVTRTYSFLRTWALEKGDKALALMAHTRLMTLLGLVGQQAESNALMEELIVGPTERPSPALADMLARRDVIFGRDDEELGDTQGRNGDQRAVFVPPPPVVDDPVGDMTTAMGPVYAALPLVIYGWILQIQGQLDASVACLRAGVAMAEESGQRSLASLAYHQWAVTTLLQGDGASSRQLNDQSRTINRAAHGPGAQLASLWPRISSGYQSLATGDLAQAESRFQQIADFLDNRDSFRTHLHSTVIGLGLVALERGEVEQARTLLAQATADPENRYPYTYVLGRLGLARIAHSQGDTAAAQAILHHTSFYAASRSLVREFAECERVGVALGVSGTL